MTRACFKTGGVALERIGNTEEVSLRLGGPTGQIGKIGRSSKRFVLYWEPENDGASHGEEHGAEVSWSGWRTGVWLRVPPDSKCRGHEKPEGR